MITTAENMHHSKRFMCPRVSIQIEIKNMYPHKTSLRRDKVREDIAYVLRGVIILLYFMRLSLYVCCGPTET